MRTRTHHSTSHRRVLAGALALGIAILLLAPAVAGALTITTQSLRPNGLSASGVFGVKPTRLTWEAFTGDDEVRSLAMVFPEGSDLSKVVVDVITLEGLKRSSVKATPSSAGRTLTLTFEPAVAPGSTLRIQVANVAFPAEGGSYQIGGSFDTSTGVQPMPVAKEPLAVRKLTTAERIINSLDNAAWVKSWNSVTFLNMFLKPQLVVASVKLEAVGWLRSMLLVAVGFPLAIPFGLMLAFAKMSKVPPVRWIASFYVNVIRGTPLFLQVYIAFFGLPLLGLEVNEYLLGMIVLAMNSSAYLTEIFRAGIQSIHKGQFEAASSLGMSYAQAMQYVIIPQTVKRILPTMTSEFILLYKDTALLSAVGVFELMMYSKNLTANTANVTPYVVAALYYLVVTTPLIRWVQTLERKLAVAEGGQSADAGKSKRSWWQWRPASAGPEAELIVSSAEHESR